MNLWLNFQREMYPETLMSCVSKRTQKVAEPIFGGAKYGIVLFTICYNYTTIQEND